MANYDFIITSVDPDVKVVHINSKERHKQVVPLENNPYCQLRYDIIGADMEGVKLHPQEQMIALGYKLLDSIPQTIADCWWFTVDKYIEPLPSYLNKIKYTIGEP